MNITMENFKTAKYDVFSIFDDRWGLLSLAYRTVVTTGQELFFEALNFYKNREFFYFRNKNCMLY